jgi:hypothetical protein
MAKRSRGHTSRPGQRPPLQRQATRPTTPPATVTAPAPAPVRPDGLTDEEEARAAQLEAAIVAEERQAETASRKARTPRTVEPTVRPTVRSSVLEVSAAEEYAYVARDVRRIALVGGSLVAILFGLWAIVTVTGIGPF